jgi:hypothetical protein
MGFYLACWNDAQQIEHPDSHHDLDSFTIDVTLFEEVLAPSLFQVEKASDMSSSVLSSKLNLHLIEKSPFEVGAERFYLKFPPGQNDDLVEHMPIGLLAL